MEKTAVEWLGFELNMLLIGITEEQWDKAKKLFQQAKEMEKQQIENAFDDGWNRANETKQQAYTTLEDMGSNYYNKTYNK